ncbi:MAG: hypothetical protein AAFX54_17515 [Pseudomonadota bacterium]
MMTEYQSYQAPRQTVLGDLARTALRGGGVMVIVAAAAFGFEWILPEGKKPLTAIATTVNTIGTIEDAAFQQTALIKSRLEGQLNRRQGIADGLIQKETGLRQGKADWTTKCNFIDIVTGGLCNMAVDRTYDPTIVSMQKQYAEYESQIAEIQETVSALPARSGAWNKREKQTFSFSFENSD